MFVSRLGFFPGILVHPLIQSGMVRIKRVVSLESLLEILCGLFV